MAGQAIKEQDYFDSESTDVSAESYGLALRIQHFTKKGRIEHCFIVQNRVVLSRAGGAV